ncbi:MAG: glycosyltransferase family 39 protein [Pyrinomonadaceae bacterium]
MAERDAKSQNVSTPAFLMAVWAAILVTIFVAFRSTDLLRLTSLLDNLGGGPLFGNSIVDSVYGIVAALLIFYSWFSIGTMIEFLIGIRPGEASWPLELARSFAIGAAAWSLIWFFLGIFGLYSSTTAIVCVVVSIANGLYVWVLVPARRPKFPGGFEALSIFLIGIPILLALVSALAPPTAKDSLLYHFSVPKAFIAQHSSIFVDGNIASYLALGTEMQVVWARLLGGLFNERAAEAGGGVAVFLFFPLLLAAIYGWARETGISKRWSLVATLTVAAVPTAYHVASSGYVDLALALFITLAIRSFCQWWKSQDTQSIILIAIFLGAALSIKLTTVFVIAAFALIVLLRARGAKDPVPIARGSDSDGKDSQAGSLRSDGAGRIVLGGFAALLLAGVFASPWYVRNWVATGSPVFPFYMSIWKGAAEGWDVERSNLFQVMNSQYGGAAANPVNYLTAPLRVSLVAQPEDPPLYDGVLGPMFLIGLPLLIWAFWKREVAVEAKIAAGVAGVIFMFWLFSSAQLRYLLPIVPALAVAIAASVETLSGRRDALNKAAKFALVGASIVCIATSFAWFCQKAPLRVVLGGETRDQYLTRNLDYYPYYQLINSDTDANAKVWLINMRRDTYHIERPVFSDYLFEDWTLRKMVWESRNTPELKAKAVALGVKYILARHDFLFDYDKSSLVDDKKSRAENDAKLRMAKELILDPANTVRADSKFSLVKVF